MMMPLPPTHASSSSARRLFGVDHPSVASALGYQGVALRLLGRYEASVERARRALAIHERTLGREHPTTAESLSVLGRSLHDTGHSQEALAVLERAPSRI